MKYKRNYQSGINDTNINKLLGEIQIGNPSQMPYYKGRTGVLTEKTALQTFAASVKKIFNKVIFFLKRPRSDYSFTELPLAIKSAFNTFT